MIGAPYRQWQVEKKYDRPVRLRTAFVIVPEGVDDETVLKETGYWGVVYTATTREAAEDHRQYLIDRAIEDGVADAATRYKVVMRLGG